MLSTQQTRDETLVNLKLLTIRKIVCITVIRINYADELKIN